VTDRGLADIARHGKALKLFVNDDMAEAKLKKKAKKYYLHKALSIIRKELKKKFKKKGKRSKIIKQIESKTKTAKYSVARRLPVNARKAVREINNGPGRAPGSSDSASFALTRLLQFLIANEGKKALEKQENEHQERQRDRAANPFEPRNALPRSESRSMAFSDWQGFDAPLPDERNWRRDRPPSSSLGAPPSSSHRGSDGGPPPGAAPAARASFRPPPLHAEDLSNLLGTANLQQIDPEMELARSSSGEERPATPWWIRPVAEPVVAVNEYALPPPGGTNNDTALLDDAIRQSREEAARKWQRSYENQQRVWHGQNAIDPSVADWIRDQIVLGEQVVEQNRRQPSPVRQLANIITVPPRPAPRPQSPSPVASYRTAPSPPIEASPPRASAEVRPYREEVREGAYANYPTPNQIFSPTSPMADFPAVDNAFTRNVQQPPRSFPSLQSRVTSTARPWSLFDTPLVSSPTEDLSRPPQILSNEIPSHILESARQLGYTDFPPINNTQQWRSPPTDRQEDVVINRPMATSGSLLSRISGQTTSVPRMTVNLRPPTFLGRPVERINNVPPPQPTPANVPRLWSSDVDMEEETGSGAFVQPKRFRHENLKRVHHRENFDLIQSRMPDRVLNRDRRERSIHVLGHEPKKPDDFYSPNTRERQIVKHEGARRMFENLTDNSSDRLMRIVYEVTDPRVLTYYARMSPETWTQFKRLANLLDVQQTDDTLESTSGADAIRDVAWRHGNEDVVEPLRRLYETGKQIYGTTADHSTGQISLRMRGLGGAHHVIQTSGHVDDLPDYLRLKHHPPDGLLAAILDKAARRNCVLNRVGADGRSLIRYYLHNRDDDDDGYVG
jgi:hypothetical protein